MYSGHINRIVKYVALVIMLYVIVTKCLTETTSGRKGVFWLTVSECLISGCLSVCPGQRLMAVSVVEEVIHFMAYRKQREHVHQGARAR
jgi:hypothetical protein